MQTAGNCRRSCFGRCARYGMRMIGPNCMGLLNADPEIRLNASFSPVFPAAGNLAMSSQSGALGLAVLALAVERQLGFSTFISVGNKADVSGNDLLQYWETDPHTGVILLYLESFGNPRRFRAHRAPRRPQQANRGDEGGTFELRPSRGGIAYGGACCKRRRRRCTLSTDGRYSRGDHRRNV